MLKLTKDKKVINDSNGEREVSPAEILPYVFSEPIGEIDGWTFGDLMRLIEPFGMFFGEMAWCRFDLFFEEMNKTAAPDKFADNIQYIMIARNVEQHGNQITEYADVYGGNDDITDEQIRADIEENGYSELSKTFAIEFTPVNLLANKPIRINDRFAIRKDILDDIEQPVVYETRKPFYLLDIIWALLYEISFAGTPADRDAKWAGIEKSIEDVRTGKVETIPAEEVFARLRERLEGGASDNPSEPVID